ncbi:AtpZ/AtpI family protein [Litorimonas sp. RW-G-Af-16]|uniref:AtpZ/AtpI family protein n=1 Tax=Litorimonas sp. RW-G-Af-16 TaxID=3241168 RepID=UPI00390C5802
MSQDKGHSPDSPSSPATDRAALAALKAKLDAKHRANEEFERQRPDGNSNLGKGIRYAGEFSAAILVGVALGYFADKLLGSSPWGLLLGLIFGFAAGVLNVTRAAKEGMDGDLGQDLPLTEEDDA